MKKILSLLSAVILTACGSAPDDASLAGGGDGGLSASKAGIFGLYDPVAASAVIPFPNDALFSGFKDPTLNIPNSTNVPFVTAANLQDGFSTTASLFTDFIGFVDFNTVATNMVIIDGSTGARLTPGTDFTLQSSTARDASGAPISAYRSRVLIEPLRPLKPSTRYIVALTTGVKSRDGVNAVAADLFRVVRSGTPVSQQTEPALNNLNSTQKATLEALRSQLVRPVVVALCGPNAGCAGGIPEANIVIAWSFTTQSVGKTLQRLNAAAGPRTIAVAPLGQNTQQLNSALAPTANVYAGILSVPYYLGNSGDSGGSPRSSVPLATFWAADPAAPDTAASFLGQVPCGAFASGATVNGQTAVPSISTTICYPNPLLKTNETIPMLVTVPNSSAPGNCGSRGTLGSTTTCVKPASGWPLVIFQHGITRSRTDMLAIAPTLAAAGFVTVAIDLPLHGITDNASALYRNQLFTGTPAAGLVVTDERTFDLDFSTNPAGACGSAPTGDGVADPSGNCFVNLASLITSRDNIRQAVSDLIALTKSVTNLDVDGTAGGDIDTSKIYFVGHSLGGTIGTTFLGVNSDVKAATLAMPGGGIAKLIDASKAFGPVISAGLSASGVVEGTDNYETYMRFAQTLVDSGDPINFAVTAAANHPIHMIEVINDRTLPNLALANDGSGALDRVTLTGFLSGTDPLYQLMGLGVSGPINPSGGAFAAPGSCSGNRVVQFGPPAHHGSILQPQVLSTDTPTADQVAVTREMQRSTATFLATHAASSGTVNLVSVPGECPAAP